MTEASELSRSDLHVLFWIMGCLKGATLDEIVTHEQRHRHPPTLEEIRQCIARLESLHLIRYDGERYHGDDQLQKDFLAQCQNCLDTVEEIGILQRIIGPRAKPANDSR